MIRIISTLLAITTSVAMAQATPLKPHDALKTKPAVTPGKNKATSGAVAVGATPGTPAPGSPADVYLNYLKATKKAKSFAEIKTYIHSGRLKEMENSAMAGEALDFCRMNVAQDIKIVAQKVEGKSATVFLEGKQSFFGAGTPELSSGTISLLQEDGNWKIEKESWKIGSGSGGTERVSEVEWSQQALDAPGAKTPAQGTIHGFPISPSVVRIAAPKNENEMTQLTFSDADFTMFPDFGISVELKDADVQGKEYVMRINDDGGVGFIHAYWSAKKTKDPSAIAIFSGTDGVGMRVKFGTAKDGSIPGTISLRCPDKEKSHLEGTFNAKIVTDSQMQAPAESQK